MPLAYVIKDEYICFIMNLPHYHDMKKLQMHSGRAIGFFNTRASPKAIKFYLPMIERMIGVPKGVKIKNTSAAKLKRNKHWRKLATEAQRSGEGRVLKGCCLGATHLKVAIEIKDVLNQAFLSPLYSDGEYDLKAFRGSVYYAEKGQMITYVRYPDRLGLSLLSEN
jgi:hypothetical protein